MTILSGCMMQERSKSLIKSVSKVSPKLVSALSIKQVPTLAPARSLGVGYYSFARSSRDKYQGFLV